MWQLPHIITNSSSGEDYCLIEILGGQGGFATTYLAIQYSDDDREKQFAIKVLKTEAEIGQQGDYETIKEQFEKENSLLERCCRNDYVVQTKGNIFTYDDRRCIVMEYVSKKTLKYYVAIDHKGKLPLNLAIKLTNQIALALQRIHQQEVFHLDIHPSNIMIRDDAQEAVLIDFGCAERLDDKEVIPSTHQGMEGYQAIELAPNYQTAIDNRNNLRKKMGR